MQTVRKKQGSTIPFGWSLHPKNGKLLIIDEHEQEILEKVVTLKKAGQSYRNLVKYIKAHTDRDLTPRGLQLILRKEEEKENDRLRRQREDSVSVG